MRLRDLGLLVLSLLIVGWGLPTTARADDVQQSHYSVVLTKPTSSSTNLNGGDGDGITGDKVNNSSSSKTSPSPTTNTNGGQGATVSPTNSQGTSAKGITGRLPQTSEAWFGFGTMAGIIMLLLVWIGILLKRRKQQN
ncbi:LPXTG cell wall anchor domain-containing protein [Levilactobacillus cerevisiae]|uniref:LPXTG cell wall anchor domain-containing protein n=1 Tax=Levilactobacillus cerevisiae TaxID=1704076 RepID=UPI000F7A4660|nr:LPXTG cell wall anchor domain-containing protein [Levilactobacillus cerevisiae]